jgi:hypothetical protein
MPMIKAPAMKKIGDETSAAEAAAWGTGARVGAAGLLVLNPLEA